jgi:hypothetical protein
MKFLVTSVIIAFTLAGCRNAGSTPDVSNIRVDLKLERFEKGFFQIDSDNLRPGLIAVHNQFPDFYNDFMEHILGVSGNPGDTATLSVCKNFLSSYASFAADLDKQYRNTDDLEREVKHGFQFVKYYFPSYRLPALVTYVGPLDAPGVALTKNDLAVGLQQYAGSDFPGYRSQQVSEMYPAYISRRFDRRYIPANCIKAVIDDLFPDKSTGKSLIEQMIEKGKQWWLLNLLIPSTPDSLKTGYTQKQLGWCRSNEGLIWNYFITNENIQTIEPDVIQGYIGEGPTTQGMPPASPGNIGQWVGWQIVKKYAAGNSSLKPEEVMRTPPGQILDAARYKPK